MIIPKVLIYKFLKGIKGITSLIINIIHIKMYSKVIQYKPYFISTAFFLMLIGVTFNFNQILNSYEKHHSNSIELIEIQRYLINKYANNVLNGEDGLVEENQKIKNYLVNSFNVLISGGQINFYNEENKILYFLLLDDNSLREKLSSNKTLLENVFNKGEELLSNKKDLNNIISFNKDIYEINKSYFESNGLITNYYIKKKEAIKNTSALINILILFCAILMLRKVFLIKKQLEESQKTLESEKTFRQLAEKQNEVFWVASSDLKKISYLSDSFEKVWGRSCEKVFELPETLINCIHKDDKKYFEEEIEKAKNTGIFNLDYRIVTPPNNKIKWIQNSGCVLTENKTQNKHLIGIAKDVTLKKEYETKKQTVDLILSNSNEITFSILKDGTITSWSKNNESLYGYNEDIVGKNILLLIPRELHRDAFRILEKINNNEDINNLDFLQVKKDGTGFKVKLSIIKTEDFLNKNESCLCIIKLASSSNIENNLLISELEFIQDNLNEGIIKCSNQGIIEEWKSTAEKIFLLKQEEVLGKYFSSLFCKNDEEKINKIFKEYKENLTSTKAFEEIFVFKTKNNEIKNIEAIFLPFKEENLLKIIIISRDVTKILAKEEVSNKLKKLEEENQKRAREVSNFILGDMLTEANIISSITNLLTENYSREIDEKGKKDLSLLISKSKRIQYMIDGLDQYLKADIVQENKTSVDVRTIINEVIKTIRPASNIIIRVENEMPTLFIEELKLLQIFKCFISNSVKFMDKAEGAISISYEDAIDKHKFSIKDNGKGIKEEKKNNLFRPFFPLQPRDEIECVGVGLYVARKIVEMYDGKIWFESKENEGSVFHFTLKKDLCDSSKE